MVDDSAASSETRTLKKIREAAQELLKYGLLEEASKPNLYRVVLTHPEEVTRILEPLDLDIAALREFGLHAVFITPNKEMRLLRDHTRSAIVVHRRGQDSNMASLSWEELEQHSQRRENA